jgi:cytoplasmic iron level regulating protein YaaA (DUF328/UPF0246 family)
MLLVISPAKSLNSDRQLPPELAPTIPRDQKRAWELIKVLREINHADIAKLMDLSDALTALNISRYDTFKAKADVPSARPAVLLFDGDVYDGLNAVSLNAAQLLAAQSQLRILSGLYGVLRPLDMMQAYRLEMGTRLITTAGKTLYDYWGEHVTSRLNEDLSEGGHTEVLNLASEEYFKSVKPTLLQSPVVDVSFLDEKNGRYKVISFFAKRARGLMARYVLDNGIKRSADLKDFDVAGYRFSKTESSENALVFKRKEQAVA